uniref:Uncharacterized protein n=1 Tax=Labrus bergylta TaxID=56723 RepID=A0A3Q3MUY3_9LABR
TVVKSRYMQAAEKSSLSKSNSLTNESMAVPPRPVSPKPTGVKPRSGTPPRRSMAPHALPSLLVKSVLQSTFAEGSCFRPDFDMSVIKGKPTQQPHMLCYLQMEVPVFFSVTLFSSIFLCKRKHSFLKMENSTAKLKVEAEARILQEMEELEALHKEVHSKKKQYLLMERRDCCTDSVAEAAKQFTTDYNTFAWAVDTTRHELPVKNFYIDDDRKEFLGCFYSYYISQSTVFDLLAIVIAFRYIALVFAKSQSASQTALTNLLEMSSLVCRHTIQVQQASEEEQLGAARAQELYCLKQ